jgi:hypothetical protein
VRAFTGACGDDASSTEIFVTPTVWQSKEPYIAPDFCGGLFSPFEILAGLYSLKQVQQLSSRLAPDIETAAMRVFGRIAAAARKLCGAGVLHMLLDTGDVVSYAQRAGHSHWAGRMHRVALRPLTASI